MKTVEDDPMFDKKRAQKKLRAFVEGNPDVIAKKAAMMVEHFHEQVVAKKKIGGKARAMVVTASIPRCIEYYYAINKCLADRHSPYNTIVAFSGEHKYNGQEPALTSAAMNGFPDTKIPKQFKKIRIGYLSLLTCSRPVSTSRCCRQCMWTSHSMILLQYRHFPA